MIRPKSKERALRMAVLVGGDVLAAIGALHAAVALRAARFVVDAPIVLLFAASLIVALELSGFYTNRVTPRSRPSFVTALVIQTALIAVGAAALARPLPRMVLLSVPAIELLVLPLWRRLLGLAAPIRPRDTILVGETHDVDEVLAGLKLADDRRIRVVGSVAPRADALAGLRDVEEVILVSPDADPRLRLALLRLRGPRGFLMLASHVDALLASRTRGWIGDQPLVEVAASCGHGMSAAVKRTVDIVGAALLIAASAPLWLLAAIAVRVDDGAPTLVRQQRVGRRGEPYTMLKFRTMRDGRITRAGALLRRYHVDELPQLINVLVGEMSLVGPRPERPELVADILRTVPDFDLRSLVRPGIAGLAQVSAEYDTRPEVKLRYDLMYMCDWSVWLDFRLMLRAISSSLAGTGR